IVFAHGSGSGRRSPRNRFVADGLRAKLGCGTLLVDLLTPAEQAIDERNGAFRFDIERLASRLERVCDWAASDARTARLHIGLFGASTGASAALRAASRRPDRARAIVSRGGRPDLAGHDALVRVRAHTLLVVGGRDDIV